MAEPPHADFVMGEWTVCPGRNRLVRGEQEERLEPRVMDLLVYLAERPGQVVSSEQIVDEVWSCHVVARSALSRSLALLRKALGDDARDPRYLETIPKRGYRLVAEVRPRVGDAEPEPAGCGLVVNGRWLRLTEGTTVIGRSSAADLRLDAPGVSRRHASITVRGDQVLLEDLGSKNGTFLDGRPVDDPTPVPDGARLVIGQQVLVFRCSDLERSTETVAP